MVSTTLKGIFCNPDLQYLRMWSFFLATGYWVNQLRWGHGEVGWTLRPLQVMFFLMNRGNFDTDKHGKNALWRWRQRMGWRSFKLKNAKQAGQTLRKQGEAQNRFAPITTEGNHPAMTLPLTFWLSYRWDNFHCISFSLCSLLRKHISTHTNWEIH